MEYMPGYRINEYQLVLPPHEELWQKILKLKTEFAEKYKLQGKPSRPHILLCQFHGWEMMEERIAQRVNAIAMGMAPFKVELKDYGSFPSHSIFINVTSRLPVQALVKELKQSQKLFKLNNEHKPFYVEEPHIPIARKLKPWQYEGGWLEYSHRHFTGRFIADGMMLLKRREGEKGAFQIVRRFAFQNLPVSIRQGDLFS